MMIIGLLHFRGRSLAQTTSANYTIYKSGKEVGRAITESVRYNNSVSYNAKTEFTLNFVKNILIEIDHASDYENGIMVNSNLTRKINGHTIFDQVIKYGNGHYKIAGSLDPIEGTPDRISHNMLLLFFEEPATSVRQIFTDGHTQFIPVIKIATHAYRIDLPDGSTQKFYYENGICERMEIKSKWNTIKLVKIKP